MKPRVAVLKTAPETVIADYGRLMRMAGYQAALDASGKTCLQAEIPWDFWFPACSTTPWQLEGVLTTLAEDGFKVEALLSSHDCQAGAGGGRGALNNGLSAVAAKFGLDFSGAGAEQEPPPGLNLILLPTVKTHALTVTAGAVGSAAAGIIAGSCHEARSAMHEAITDMLALRKEAHAGLFAVMDGTFCGDGPGPLALMPFEKDYIIAGADLVAVDAVAAKMMGFDPMEIGYIRMAHERGLGCGEISGIDVEGEEISEVDFHFHDTSGAPGSRAKGSSRCGAGRLSGLPIADSTLAARAYYDHIWYPWVGWQRLSRMAETGWGQMLQGLLPRGAELENQAPGKSPLILAAAGAIIGMSAFRRVMAVARGRA